MRILSRSDGRLANDLDGRRPGEQLMAGKPHVTHASGSELFDQAVASDPDTVVQQVIANLQNRVLTACERRAQHVSKLPDIAWPPVALQPLERLIRKYRNGPARLFRLPAQDVRGEHG